MKVRNVIVSIILLVFAGSVSFAQHRKPDGDKGNPDFMQKAIAERSDFIVSRLDLDDEATQVFLVLFNEIEDAKHQAFDQRHEKFAELCKAVDKKKEKEIIEAYKAYKEALDRLDAVCDESDRKLAAFLTPVQMAKFVIADEEFRRSKIHKLNGKSGGPGEGKPEGRPEGRPDGRPEGRPDGRPPRNGGYGNPWGEPMR
ncbi:MAG: hypothetical protein ACI39U_04820 [Candidatus Cryptobacteroides sp.]